MEPDFTPEEFLFIIKSEINNHDNLFYTDEKYRTDYDNTELKEFNLYKDNFFYFINWQRNYLQIPIETFNQRYGKLVRTNKINRIKNGIY
jgi:hypothetical protein